MQTYIDDFKTMTCFSSYFIFSLRVVRSRMLYWKYDKDELIINDLYRLIRKIGCGSFGVIYLGVNQKNGEVGFICTFNPKIQEVAVKVERNSARHRQLAYESKVYRILNGGIGIPRLR